MEQPLGKGKTYSKAGFVATFLLGGIILDFLSNGVLKIGAMVIWGTVYFGLACLIGTELLRTRWEHWTRYGVIAFIVGSYGGHWVMTGNHSMQVYPMSLAPHSDSPITLRSDAFPQTLLVNSEKLKAELAHHDPHDTLPVSVLVTRDYGCIQSFVVDQIAGIDVRIDPTANWAWKGDPNAGNVLLSRPGLEAPTLPWCPKTNLKLITAL